MLNIVNDICKSKCGHNEDNNNISRIAASASSSNTNTNSNMKRRTNSNNNSNNDYYFGNNDPNTVTSNSCNVSRLQNDDTNNSDAMEMDSSTVAAAAPAEAPTNPFDFDNLALFERCSSSTQMDFEHRWDGNKTNRSTSKSLERLLCKHIECNRSSQVLDLRRTKSTTGMHKYNSRMNNIDGGTVMANGKFKINRNHRNRIDNGPSSSGAGAAVATQLIFTNNMDNDGVRKSSVSLRRPHLSATAAMAPTAADVIGCFNASSTKKRRRPKTPQTSSDEMNSVRIGDEHAAPIKSSTMSKNIGTGNAKSGDVDENATDNGTGGGGSETTTMRTTPCNNEHIDRPFNGNETNSVRKLKTNTNPFLDHEIIESKCTLAMEAAASPTPRTTTAVACAKEQLTNDVEKPISFQFNNNDDENDIDNGDDIASIKMTAKTRKTATETETAPPTMYVKSDWLNESSDDYGNELFNHKSCSSRQKPKQKHDYQTTNSSPDGNSALEQRHSALTLSSITTEIGIGKEHPTAAKDVKSNRRHKFVGRNANDAKLLHNRANRNRFQQDRSGSTGQLRRPTNGADPQSSALNYLGFGCGNSGGGGSSSRSNHALDARQTTKYAMSSASDIPTCPFLRQDYGTADVPLDHRMNKKSKTDLLFSRVLSRIGSGGHGYKDADAAVATTDVYAADVEENFYASNGIGGGAAAAKVPTPRLKKLNINYPNRTQLIDDAERVHRDEPNVFDKTKKSLIKIGQKCGLKWQKSPERKYNGAHPRRSSYTAIDTTRPHGAHGPMTTTTTVTTTTMSNRIAKAPYKSYRSEIDLTRKLNYLDAFLNENFAELSQPHSSSHSIGKYTSNHHPSMRYDGIAIASNHKRTKSCTKAIDLRYGAYESSRNRLADGGGDFDKTKHSHFASGRDDIAGPPFAAAAAYISSSCERSGKSHTTSSSLSSSDYASVYSPCCSSNSSGAQLIDQQTKYSSGSCYLSPCNDYVSRCDAPTLDAGAAVNIPMQFKSSMRYDKRQKIISMNNQHNDDGPFNDSYSLAFNGGNGVTRPLCDNDEYDVNGQRIIDRQKLTTTVSSAASSSLSSSSTMTSTTTTMPTMPEQSLYQYENQLTYYGNNDSHLTQVYHQQQRHQHQRQPIPHASTTTANQFYAHKITICKQQKYPQHHVVITKPKNSCSSSDVVLEYEC